MINNSDQDPLETKEWLEALESTIETSGKERAGYLLSRLAQQFSIKGGNPSFNLTTPFKNTIDYLEEPKLPGDLFIERNIRSYTRWNALAMVMRANLKEGELGGHISTFMSSAMLYDVGFNHFFHAPSKDHPGDLVYFQGHSSPGIYARSFLEGRLSADQLDKFRMESDGTGLSSYPHPWLMPDYWQFPTVSMGLGPITGIYQAYIQKYLQSRKVIKKSNQKIWVFAGDGEMDEPESLGAISMAGREKLDNLIMVINCNLQRLDGPVRGNSKIIQELEGVFRGAGWNVVKVIWGRHWDPILAKDKSGKLQKLMNEVVDGEMQNFKAKGGAYTRKHFFAKDPEVLKLVEELSDDEIYKLNRGGHDPYKVHAAYDKAIKTKEQPTVILALTVKGYGTGSMEADNTTHQVKNLSLDNLKQFRDRFNLPVSDKDLPNTPYVSFPEGSPELEYLKKQRAKLGGFLPQRNQDFRAIKKISIENFKDAFEGTRTRQVSTTMAVVRIITKLTKDSLLGKKVVPIVPDEARTFGMEGLFRQLGIYSSQGQLYEPEDADQVMYYRESKEGVILEEGVTEAGAFSAWLALATAYSNYGKLMIPFYLFYSMFGFQRIMDLIWAAGDSQARGFLIGATSGKTTLNGEGLQHQDGHSHLLAATIPNCKSYDPTYAYELAIIIEHGMKVMFQKKEKCFFYITTMNENYPHPKMPSGVKKGIIKGMYQIKQQRPSKSQKGLEVDLLGSGAILREVEEAALILSEEYGVKATVWSVTSFNELKREGSEVERWNRLNPERKEKVPYVSSLLSKSSNPVIAATDYVKSYPEQIRPFIDQPYTCLGTDGFGRSDTRENLRSFFEVDKYHIAYAALYALYKDSRIEKKQVIKALNKFDIDQQSKNPSTR